jgi:sensor histidine kinase YesM
VDIIVPTEISVEIMDLSTILANLLDNALQALEKVKENKQLSVNIKYRKGVLLICISNTYNGIVKFENGEIITTKEKPREHGYGLRNVEAVAQKYDGVCNFTHDNTIFKADVLLYV